MALTASERHRRALTASLREQGMLRSARIEAAFQAVPRERFLPDTLSDGGLEAVYRDDAIVTKRTAQGLPLSSSSQPAIMAEMLEMLDVQPGDRVLEIGAGTGYNAALLAHLAGPSGRVTSIDIDADLARNARRALRGTRVKVVAGDGRDGDQAHAPYDRIIATASADQIPSAWLGQLREGGRLVVPLRLGPDGAAIQVIPVLERRGMTLRSVGMTWGGFMPLHNGDGDGGHRRPAANLSVVHSVKDRHTGLMSLTGGGIGRLNQAAARDLIVSLLSEPSTPRRSGVTDRHGRLPPSLLTYLLLNIPADRRISLRHKGRSGIGLVDRQSIAIVSLPSPRSNQANPPAHVRWRLDAYREGQAATKLERLLDQWQQLARARQTSLKITASGRGQTLRLTFTWEA